MQRSTKSRAVCVAVTLTLLHLVMENVFYMRIVICECECECGHVFNVRPLHDQSGLVISQRGTNEDTDGLILRLTSNRVACTHDVCSRVSCYLGIMFYLEKDLTHC